MVNVEKNAAGAARRFKIAVLVLLAFVGPRPKPRMDARHLNDDRCDDRLENLAWGTRQQNMQDAIRNGKAALGERHGCAKITALQAVQLRGAHGKDRDRLAREFGIGPRQARRIAAGDNWKDWSLRQRKTVEK